ncbi:universal stress protein [Halobellus sp. EA9]|uniref:universal stress protein n=1 Tax=Halobellus sp. EA9 TaxID=3421647 RepID=UPI003EB7991B
MFEHILIPVDGSNPARRATKYGLELAVKYDATVEILHAWSEGRSSGETDPEVRGRDLVSEATAVEVDGDLTVETAVVQGKPHRVIGDRVAERNADLVVMGRRGRSGIGEHLLGSVPERVLRTVEVPVLTVPGTEVAPETGRSYSDLLLTTDGSEVSKRAAPIGADLARRLTATLHVFTAVDVQAEAGVFDAGGITGTYVERLKDQRREALDSLVDELDTADLDIQREVADGNVHEALDDYATEHGVDLVVIASEGETNILGQHLGSTARRVLQTVQRPVLVVPVTE